MKLSLFPAGTYVESCVVKPLTLVGSNKSAPVNPPVSEGMAAIDPKCVHLLTHASPLSLALAPFPWLRCALPRCVGHVTLTRRAGET
jgi:hypothetical protein